MNRELVIAEWKRGLESLEAAEVLTEAGWAADAISRAYYAVLHASKAPLLVEDVTADSHAAVRRLVGLHLVKTGILEREWAACLAEILDDRLVADYDVETVFTPEGARLEVRRARDFQKRIKRFLLDKGFRLKELR